MKEEFDKGGIAYESPGVRIEKLEESLQILDILLRGQECTFEGKHYQVRGLKGSPRPRQGPRTADHRRWRRTEDARSRREVRGHHLGRHTDQP